MIWLKNYNEILNQIIEEIENNLENEIDYKKLASIAGVSEYSLQRIFMFLTNMSISEYIRKRRLSKAFEELKTKDIKIIDLAIKYQYDSSISFSRAFKNMFGITPSKCKNEETKYQQFPIIRFKDNQNVCKELNYEIKEIEPIKLYCVGTKAKTNEDLLFNIRELYNKIKKEGLHQEFNKIGMYGISAHKDDMQFYYIGCKIKYDNTEEFIIPKGKYAIFNVGSREQKDIVKTEETIYTQWLPSTNYMIDKKLNFELYIENNCYLYVPIKNKQN